MPGGVNSPVRAFKSVGGQPIVMDSVKGSHMWDIDGNEYIDYVGSWGPAIIGHADDEVHSLFLKLILHVSSSGIKNWIYLQFMLHLFAFSIYAWVDGNTISKSVCLFVDISLPTGACSLGRHAEERNKFWCSLSS